MNRSETAQLLAMCAGVDQRTVGETDVQVWHALLGDVDLPDARAALIGHYADSTERVMPAHIRKRARAAREQRLAHADARGIPAADPDDVHSYLAALRGGRHRDASDHQPRPVGELLTDVFRRPDGALPPGETAARARHLRDQLPRRTA